MNALQQGIPDRIGLYIHGVPPTALRSSESSCLLGVYWPEFNPPASAFGPNCVATLVLVHEGAVHPPRNKPSSMQEYRVGFRIAWRGGEVNQAPAPSQRPSESGGGPILYSPSLPSSRNGSRLSLGELHETCLARPFDNDRLLPDRWLHAGSLLADGVMMQLDWAVP